MNNSLTWLHISDLHFKIADNWDSNYILKSLIADLKSYKDETGLNVDLVFVTGDISYSGKAEEYRLALCFFEKLQKTLNLENEKIFFVPGNHDIDYNEISYTSKAIKSRIIHEKSESEISKLLNDKFAKESIITPLNNYLSFINKQSQFSADTPSYKQKLKINSLQREISIIGLNSAWLTLDDSQPIIGRQQVQKAYEDIDETDIVITLVHHPFYLLQDWERESIIDIVEHNSDFLLRGHTHRSRIEMFHQSPTRCITIGAGGAFTSGLSSNNYNLVKMDFEQETITTHFRQFRPEGSKWVEDIFFKDPLPGQYEMSLSKRLKKEKKDTEITYESNFKSIWLQIETKNTNDEIDVSEILYLIGNILNDKKIKLLNVKTGSFWLQISLSTESYIKLLELFTEKSDRLTNLNDKYIVNHVGREYDKLKKYLPQEQQYKKIKIFLSSSYDLREERDIVAETVNELNKTIADDKKIVLDLIRWETDAIPNMGRPQEIINKSLNNIDIFIGILGQRFGTPTGKADSGTEEEFNIAYDSWSKNGKPQILFYFKDVELKIKEINWKQMMKVFQFRDRIATKGLYSVFNDQYEFKTQIYKHLYSIVNSYVK